MKRTTYNSQVKQQAPGKFIELKQGEVHYEFSGPEDGDVVVLVHGLTGPMFVWEKNIEPLTAAGYRVLRYDLYGRGYSARPEVEYNEVLFKEQLLELLDALSIQSKISLVGLSMGGFVSALVANSIPDRINRLHLVDSFGLQVNKKPIALLAKREKLGNFLMRTLGNLLLLKGTSRAFAEPKKHPEYKEAFIKQLQIKGFKRAILRTYRNLITHDYSHEFSRLNEQLFPVKLTWGSLDKILPLDYGKQLHGLVSRAQFEVLDGCGHMPNYEKPEDFNRILLDFLRE